MSLRLLVALAGIALSSWMGSFSYGQDQPEAPDSTPAKAAAAEDAKADEKADETPAKPDEEKPAAETPAKESKADAPKADPAKLQEAQQQFDEVVAQWKDGLKELALLQDAYRKADESKQKEMVTEFNDKRKKLAQEVKPRLIEAGIQLYKLEGKGNQDLQSFMRMILLEKFQEDRWQDLYEMTHVLQESGLDEPQLNLFEAISAYGIHRFDEAEENIELAAEAGLLQPSQNPDSDHELVARRRDIGRQIRATATQYKDLWKEEQAYREAEAKADDLPRVKLQTSKGDIVIELFENEAPNTVANFISLVEKGYYDGLIFHRVLPGFMAQGGDPQGTGSGGPGYRIPCECYKDKIRNHFTGSLSMAKTAARDTGGSQFFITFRPTPHLNGAHTVFGRVIEGLDVLPDLERIDPSARSTQGEPDKIIKATVVRKRDHEYVPKTLPEF